MNTPILVLFDCDGTLIDSVHIIYDCMVRTFDAYHETRPSEAETRDIIGLSLDRAIARLLTTPVNGRILEMVAFYKKTYNIVRQTPDFKEPLYPHIKELLETLVQMDNVVLGIVTGKSRRGVKLLCDAYGFDFFHVVRTADDCSSKPAPDMVLECCEQTGIEPKNTFVIGDSIYDMQMAVAAKAIPIAVSWGYGSAQALKDAGAHYLVKQPGEILSILRGFDA